MSAWKQMERDSAALFGCQRFWSNSGERADFVTAEGLTGQCKLVKTLSLSALTYLAEEVDIVCVKVRRGSGQPSEPLVVMTFAKFEKYRERMGGHEKPEAREG